MIVRYNPYKQDLPQGRDELFAPFSSMVDKIWNNRIDFQKSVSGESFTEGAYPRCNVLDEENMIVIKAGVPGLTKDDIKVEITEDVLVISSKEPTILNKNKKNYIKEELKISSWSRSFLINDTLDLESVKAVVTNGLLTVSIEKKNPSKHNSKTRVVSIT